MKFGKRSAESNWKTVELDGESFEVELRRPTLEECVRDNETFEGFSWLRIQSCIVNWRGVVGDDGKPVPFSAENLRTFCEFQPRLIPKLGALVAPLYDGMTEDSRKNSSEPPVEQSPVAQNNDATPETSTLSPSGPSIGS